MKILCTVHGKPAMVVGYGQGRKGRPVAIVVCEGKLRDVRLKDVELAEDTRAMPENVELLERRKK